MRYLTALIALCLSVVSFASETPCLHCNLSNFDPPVISAESSRRATYAPPINSSAESNSGVEKVFLAHHSTPTSIAGLENFTTYRIYAKLLNPLDRIQAVFGEADANWMINSTTGFYQNPAGGAFAESIYPPFYEAFPGLEFDSWIAVEAEPGEIDNFSAISIEDELALWEQEMNFHVSSGSIYSSYSDAPMAGEDLMILLGQVTVLSSAVITGNFNFQIIPLSNPSASEQFLNFPLIITNGCTEPSACNYNFEATFSGEL